MAAGRLIEGEAEKAPGAGAHAGERSERRHDTRAAASPGPRSTLVQTSRRPEGRSCGPGGCSERERMPSKPTLRCSVRVFGVGLVVAAGLAGSVSPAQAASGCTKVASPSGSDSASGSEAAPFRSAQKLADSLASGQTGCLRAGTYTDSAFSVVAPHTDNITLRSYPGERAKLSGQIEIANARRRHPLRREHRRHRQLRLQHAADLLRQHRDREQRHHQQLARTQLPHARQQQRRRPSSPTHDPPQPLPRMRQPRQRQPRPRDLRRQHRRRRDHRQPLLQLRRLHHPALPQLPTHPLRPQRR